MPTDLRSDLRLLQLPLALLFIVVGLSGCGDTTQSTASAESRLDAVDDTAEVSEDEAIEIDVLANDALDGGEAVWVEVTQPSNGRAETVGDMIEYVPEADFFGDDEFSYTIEVAEETLRATVRVTVVGVNDAPDAVDDFLGVIEGQSNRLDVRLNDVDADGDPLEIAIIEPPQSGRAQIGDDGELIYEARADHNGFDRLSYTITDAEGLTSEADVFLGVYEHADQGAPAFRLPRTSIQPEELAVVVNTNDETSQAVANYYLQARQIPAENLIEVALPPQEDVISPQDFEAVMAEVDSQLGDGIQAYALAWLRPYRVGCMSMTSAFALGGYDDAYCDTSSDPCSVTAPVDYYQSESTRPFADHGIRPAMMLAGVDEQNVRDLIDRGVAADATFPGGTGYLIRTTDVPRSQPRWMDFMQLPDAWAGVLELVYRDNSDGSGSNVVSDQDDVLFYFTGLTRVDALDTNVYLPGAVADHVTSYGGRLTSQGGQMSIVRWLEAGATASYGTVVEPCNYPNKFPRVSTLISAYYRGQTVLEAYWKSVHWPGEGVFIGEPLARPWGRSFVRFDDGTLTIRTTSLAVGRRYELVGRPTPDGEATVVQGEIQIDRPQMLEITVDAIEWPFLELRPAE